MVEVTGEREVRRHDEVLWNDRSYQDANDPRFHSRKSHRDYMKREGLTTVDDFKGHFANAGKARERYYTDGHDPSRRADVARAMERRRG